MAFDILLRHGGTGLKDFLSALVKPLQTTTDSMKDFETEYKKRAKFNGQKIVLQAALNDIFGITSVPYIVIETIETIGTNNYFYNEAELSPVYINNDAEQDPVFIFNEAEVVGDYDFKVLIPAGIHTTELERRVSAETTLYKLVGKRFIIETY